MAGGPGETIDVAAIRARFSSLRQGFAFLDAPGGSQVPDEVGDAKWITQIGRDQPAERVGTLAHQTGIGAIKQDGANVGVGPAQKTFDATRRGFHNPASCLFCINKIIRATSSRRISSTARTEASSRATTVL